MKFSRKHIFALLVGVITVYSIDLLCQVVSQLLSFHQIQAMRDLSIDELVPPFTQQPYLTFRWILDGISYLAPVVGGVVIGMRVKEKAWAYAGILGLILNIMSSMFFFAIIFYLLNFPHLYLPEEFTEAQKQHALTSMFPKTTAPTYIGTFLLSTIIVCIKCGIGGVLGQRFLQRRKH